MEEKLFVIEDGVLIKYTGNEKNVSIPACVTKICRYAFDGCTSVETISIPAGVMEIGTDMYSYYEECFEEMFDDDDYEQYDLPEICWGAFEGCTSLKEIRYGGTMAQWLFMLGGCNLDSPVHVAVSCSDGDALAVRSDLLKRRKMTEITLPGNIVKIAPRAFTGYPSLASVKIPGSVVMIGGEAFKGCTSLGSVEYDDTMEEWERVEGKVNLLSYIPAAEVKCADGVWVRPAVLVEHGTLVACLDKDAVSVTVPDGVTEIAGRVFAGLKKIGRKAFAGSTSLTAVSIPEGVTKIDRKEFAGCTSLTAVNISEGVSCIDSDAFKGCTSLTSLSIPGSMTYIGKGAFSNCTSLSEIHYGGTTAQWLFELAGFTHVPRNIVIHCTDGDAKPVSKKITEIVIPGDVTKIGAGAFRCCTLLTSVEYAGTMAEWERVEGKKNLLSCIPAAEVKCADGVWVRPAVQVEHGTLVRCLDKNAVSVTVPDGVTRIAKGAFKRCRALTTVVIPRSVQNIDDYKEFSGCPSLREIRYGGTKEQWNDICKGMLYHAGGFIHGELEDKRDVWNFPGMPKLIQCADGSLERT